MMNKENIKMIKENLPYSYQIDSGKFIYFGSEEIRDEFKKSEEEKYTSNTISKEEGLNLLKDSIKNNKPFYTRFPTYDGKDVIWGMCSVESIEKNTKDTLTFTVDDDIGTSKLKIKNRGRKYFVEVFDENKMTRKLKFTSHKNLQFEFEYNLNGLYWFLSNKNQKIEMFPNYKSFPVINGFSNIR